MNVNEQWGILEPVCDHVYHLECIEKWSKISNTCPLDRKSFTSIAISVLKNDEKSPETNRIISRRIQVEERAASVSNYISNLLGGGEDSEQAVRRICKECQRPASRSQNAMIECGGCGDAYHRRCLRGQDLNFDEIWLCSSCLDLRQHEAQRQQRQNLLNPYLQKPGALSSRQSLSSSSISGASYIRASADEATSSTSSRDTKSEIRDRSIQRLRRDLLRDVYDSVRSHSDQNSSSYVDFGRYDLKRILKKHGKSKSKQKPHLSKLKASQLSKLPSVLMEDYQDAKSRRKSVTNTSQLSDQTDKESTENAFSSQLWEDFEMARNLSSTASVRKKSKKKS